MTYESADIFVQMNIMWEFLANYRNRCFYDAMVEKKLGGFMLLQVILTFQMRWRGPFRLRRWVMPLLLFQPKKKRNKPLLDSLGTPRKQRIFAFMMQWWRSLEDLCFCRDLCNYHSMSKELLGEPMNPLVTIELCQRAFFCFFE
ncbi:uncharacterized protein LOC110033625 isoform X2 [Phalaenopsis equestris]|uniref:uncharacterized protein LOC110033625 isoform X2 n=1 Tax=Phalaenopsis equestris TaxID=78828 RepID=UPI0009E29095|nr:uncharacterized protein LOC110033625 isoform X2 [Phalaenopsis equestris]